ncbi:MAG: flagellar biosynthesis protein FlhB [Chloroflexi bacterium]|nr:flagellar biosynthesis protein FlhB [Chloroflexota bacterium]
MAEKTEAPTGRRLAEARREGQVARSHELNAAAALLVGAWLLSGPGKNLLADLQSLLVVSLTSLPTVELNQAWLRNLAVTDLLRLGADLGVIVFGMLLTGVAVTEAQTNFLFTSKKIGFDINRINPLQGFKRLFSGQGLMEMLKALLKLLVVGWIAYSFVRGRTQELLGLTQTSFLSALGYWGQMASALMLRVGMAYLVLAVLDYAYQRWYLMRSLRMTKDEIKEEFKQTEGDPVIKGRIRTQQRRMARMRMMANVPKADVVITNPTHLAIAIRYDQGAMKAPQVLAKGAHHTAERIVAIARERQIPVVQNIPLARAIYRLVDVDQEIPPELYLAMAEVLAYVYKLRGAPMPAAAAN